MQIQFYFYVFINSFSLSLNIDNINIGVPQGSSLGPLVFLIYINDLLTSFNFCPHLFADNTCLIVSVTTPDDLQIRLNIETTAISKFVTINKC